MNKTLFGLLFFFFAGMISCGHSTGSLFAWKEKKPTYSNSTQVVREGPVVMSAKYLPRNYLQAVDEKRNIEKSDYEYMYYFDFELNVGDDMQLGKNKVTYMNFDIQNDFMLTVGKELLSPVICQKIEKGFSSSYKYIVVFENKQMKENEKLVFTYKDKIFALGEKHFYFEDKLIQ